MRSHTDLPVELALKNALVVSQHFFLYLLRSLTARRTGCATVRSVRHTHPEGVCVGVWHTATERALALPLSSGALPWRRHQKPDAP
jgi:hypothetical protein